MPVTDAMLQNPDPADWLMWRRTLDLWGHSPLAEIDRGNVGELKMVWTRALGPGIQEGTPLVYDGVMYFPNPSDLVQALDAATGDLKWEYRRSLPTDLAEYFPVPSINRNLAIYADTLIDTSSDDYLYALDARTGKLAWEVQLFDYRRGAQHTSGPIIADGKIISGRGCEPEGSPAACVIMAHDARTGRELWRRRTIAAPGEPNGDSWGTLADEERWHVGSWLVPSYDPELDLIFAGTSVTSPAPKFALAGNDKQYLYHNSTLALNADTGEIVWYYQHIVDHWDLDHPYERLLVETAVAPDRNEVTWINPRVRSGERRKVVTGIPGKTGIVYTLDRATGEFLWARPTVQQNVLASIDGLTGDVTVNPDALFVEVGQQRFICPTSLGGKNWPSRNVEPAGQRDVLPAAEHLHDVRSDVEPPEPGLALRFEQHESDRTERHECRQHPCDLRRDRQDAVDLRAARRNDVAAVDGRRPRVRRRHERPVSRVRPTDGPGLVGSESRLADLGLPRELRRRRQTICRRQHGLVVDCDGRESADARAHTELGQQSVRLRTAELTPRPDALTGITVMKRH